MRELTVVGLDADAKNLICESADSAERFRVAVDERLRAGARGDRASFEQDALDIVVTDMLTPKEIQARIRAGATVEQLAAASGSDVARIQRFANPVLLERFRAAELATAAHPILADGPAVGTLLESVTAGFLTRGLTPERLTWDAWRNSDLRWTVQLTWAIGHSENHAHFRYVPGAHGGTITAIDDAASELIDPEFKPPLRPLAPVARLAFDGPAPAPEAQAAAESAPRRAPARKGKAQSTHSAKPAPSTIAADHSEDGTSDSATPQRRGKPAIPAWEDVLLGVRSSGQS